MTCHVKDYQKNSKTQPRSASLKQKASVSNFKLQPMNPCVAGIDIGASSVFTCVGFPDGHQEGKRLI